MEAAHSQVGWADSHARKMIFTTLPKRKVTQQKELREAEKGEF